MNFKHVEQKKADSPTQEQSSQVKKPGFFEPTNAFGNKAAESFLDSFLGLPNAVIRGGNYAQSGLNSLANNAIEGLTGKQMPGLADFLVGPAPERNEGVLPMPSGRQVMSGTMSALGPLASGLAAPIYGALGKEPPNIENPMNIFDNYKKQMGQRSLLESENPIESKLGEIVGGGLAATATRRPFLKAGQESADIIAPKISDRFKDAGFTEEFSETMGRVIGRPSEGAIEAVIFSLQEESGDPVDAAIFGAASQVGGLLGLKFGETVGINQLLRGDFQEGFKQLGGSAVTMTVLYQLLKNFDGLDRERILESTEAGFSKVATLIGVGAFAGLTGAGRIGADRTVLDGKRSIAFMDAVSTIPRAATLKFANQLMSDRNVEQMMDQIVENPESVNEEDWKLIDRAFRKGRLGDFAADFMENQ